MKKKAGKVTDKDVTDAINESMGYTKWVIHEIDS